MALTPYGPARLTELPTVEPVSMQEVRIVSEVGRQADGAESALRIERQVAGRSTLEACRRLTPLIL